LASLRDIRNRIRSVKNTQKITKAYQVVSATKLRRAQQMVQATRPYAEKMLEVLETAAARSSEYRHPFLERREGTRALVILVTSDRGLAHGPPPLTPGGGRERAPRECPGQAAARGA